MTDKQQELLMDDDITDQQVLDCNVSVGETLKNARTAGGLSIEEVSGQLHLRPSLVREIESDNFDSISSATYARGYVRNYARIVGISDDEILSILESQIPSETEPTMQSFSRKTSRQARDSRLMMVTWLIAAVLLALLVLWWLQKSNMNDGLDLSLPSDEEVAAAQELDTQRTEQPNANHSQPLVQVANATDISLSVNGVAQPQQRQPEPKAQPETELQAEILAPQSEILGTQSDATRLEVPDADNSIVETSLADNDVNDINAYVNLNVSVSGDCWMKVEDATGKVLISGIKRAGRVMNVEGLTPFNFVIGAPQVVSIQLNGENVSLADYPAGKVARFSLPKQ